VTSPCLPTAAGSPMHLPAVHRLPLPAPTWTSPPACRVTLPRAIADRCPQVAAPRSPQPPSQSRVQSRRVSGLRAAAASKAAGKSSAAAVELPSSREASVSVRVLAGPNNNSPSVSDTAQDAFVVLLALTRP